MQLERTGTCVAIQFGRAGIEALVLRRRRLHNDDRTEAREVSSVWEAARSSSNPIASKDAPTNPRGIPVAPFVDRVEDYVTDRSEVESTVNSFKEMIA